MLNIIFVIFMPLVIMLPRWQESRRVIVLWWAACWCLFVAVTPVIS